MHENKNICKFVISWSDLKKLKYDSFLSANYVRIGWANIKTHMTASLVRIVLLLLHLLLLLLVPVRALARKWRKTNHAQPSTPIQSNLRVNYIHDFSFSDGTNFKTKLT